MEVIVDTAEYPEEIDARRAEEAKIRAEEAMRQKQSILEYNHSQAALSRAMTRLKVKVDNTITISKSIQTTFVVWVGFFNGINIFMKKL